MHRALAVAFLMVVSTFFLVEADAQTYEINFNQFPGDVLAENLGISGVTFAPSPTGSWETVDSRLLLFVGLGETCLYQPFNPGTLDITFQTAVSSVSFSFAQSDVTSTSQLKAEAFSGSTSVGSVIQNASVPAGADFSEGFVNLSPGAPFNRIRISSVTPHLIAIDNLRADGVLIVLVSQPRGMLQVAGSGGATDSYTIANRGSVSASVTLTQSGNFFTQNPPSFSLPAGAAQRISLAGTSQGPGSFAGTSIVSATGAPQIRVPVTLLSAVPPSGTVRPVPSSNRIDLAAVQGQNPSGSVAFRNDGSSTIQAIAVSDAPWLIPQSGVITIAPGQTVNVTFRVDRSLRIDGAASLGSVVGTLKLRFLTSASARAPFDTSAGASLVSVVDTTKPATSPNAIPPLSGPAFFLTGIGHVTGGGGIVYISDVTIGNAVDAFSIGNLSLYFTPRDGTPASASQSSISTLLPNQAVSLADVVKNVYGKDESVGSLQIRAGAIQSLAVAASIFNSNDPRGTFGTAIPVLRSDRSITTGKKLYFPGLIQDATHRTNFYLQETGGGTAAFRTDFLNVTGNVIGTRNDSVPPFQMLQIAGQAPAGTAAAVVTQTSGDGSLSGYATPLDTASGDTWAVTDWNNAFGSSPTETVLIPIAGSLAGALGTFFRSDVAVTNIGAAGGTIRLTYRPSGGTEIVRTTNLAPNQSFVSTDIVKSFFNVSGDSLGYILVNPLGRSITVTSRAYTTVSGSTATFGTAVPALPLSASLALGQKKVIGGLQDSSLETLSAGTPGTFRTNVDMVETAGAAATVKVTLLFADGRSLAGGPIASKSYPLQPNQLLRINGITNNILDAARADYGDIRNLQLKFEVVGGSGRVAITVSSIDNGTGDSILRVE
ncbi:MAG: hypothetical protein NDJ92_14515 [Thermoanaerobaculia bacterium]|nr:hypothetical protein [Thermoanaerobaculia bacterium]